MSEPSPNQIRVRLAELLGWQVDPPGLQGRKLALNPDGSAFHVDALPDPANDLNAMAAVEAALRDRDLQEAYVRALWPLLPPGPEMMSSNPAVAQFRVATAPAAVRALAAYRVLEAKS
jgi:hypothetical protein